MDTFALELVDFPICLRPGIAMFNKHSERSAALQSTSQFRARFGAIQFCSIGETVVTTPKVGNATLK